MLSIKGIKRVNSEFSSQTFFFLFLLFCISTRGWLFTKLMVMYTSQIITLYTLSFSMLYINYISIKLEVKDTPITKTSKISLFSVPLLLVCLLNFTAMDCLNNSKDPSLVLGLSDLANKIAGCWF